MTRPILLLALLTAELLAVSISFDARPQAELAASGSWTGYLAQAGNFARFLSVATAALLVLTAQRLPAYLSALSLSATARSSPGGVLSLVGLQVLCAVVFFVVSGILFSVPTILDESSRQWFLAGWIVTGALLVTTWGLALAPFEFWATFLRQERLTLGLAALAGLLAVVVAYFAQRLWSGLAHAALLLTHGLLQGLYDDVQLDIEELQLGVKGFVVTIGYPCSGYEGIGLISLFTALYLYVFRAEFRFPQALLLFPVGIVAIWLFNILRIALLIIIGAEFSPDLALGGFHSQAGWISFLLVSIGMLHLAHQYAFRKAEEGVAAPPVSQGRNMAQATLLPLLAVLAATLLTGALSSGVDWLYPLRVAAGATALAYCWRSLALPAIRFKVSSILVGIAVFLLWLLLAPPLDYGEFAAPRERLGDQSPWLWLWLSFRFAGTAVIVPVVEELAFRGYLLARLSRQDVELTGRPRFTWTAVLTSSLLFGLLHDAWLAGTVAGIAYAALRMKSNDIWQPIVAHAVTNGLLFVLLLSSA